MDDAATARLAGWDFGWCNECCEFIGLKRLDLDPVNERCVRFARQAMLAGAAAESGAPRGAPLIVIR